MTHVVVLIVFHNHIVSLIKSLKLRPGLSTAIVNGDLVNFFGSKIGRNTAGLQFFNYLCFLRLRVTAPDDNLTLASAQPGNIVFLCIEFDDMMIRE